MTGTFCPEEGIALLTAGPALADRVVREMAIPAPSVSAASNASRRFIRVWVIGSFLRTQAARRIVHPLPGLPPPRPFGHAPTDDLPTAAGRGHYCPEGRDSRGSAGHSESG